MAETILQVLERGIASFTDAQKRVADYLLKNPSEVAFMTIEKLAHNSGVSVATIMRLAYALDYEGYSEMQKELQKIILQQVTPAGQLASSVKKLTNNKLLLRCAEMQIENIRKTVEFIPDETASESVEMILRAKRLFLAGARSSLATVNYLYEGLNRIGFDCAMLAPESGRTLSLLSHMTPDCLVIAISFPRYVRRTLEITTVAKARGARILGITDGHSSPLAAIADMFIPCAFSTLSFLNSSLGAIFVADYLISALSLNDPKKVTQELDGIEEVIRRLDATILK